MKLKYSVDIVFLLDVTSAMQACLGDFKRCVHNLLDSLSEPKALEGSWRMRVIGFRDRDSEGSAWWVDHPFTSDASEVRSHMQELVCKGGGDEPDSLLDALHAVTHWPVAERGEATAPTNWRHHVDADRIVVIVSDASFKPEFSLADGSRGDVADVIHAIHATRTTILLFAPEAPGYTELGTSNGLEWVPLGALGGNDPLIAMREYFAEKATDTTWLFSWIARRAMVDAPLDPEVSATE
jgi:hypothetical protein